MIDVLDFNKHDVELVSGNQTEIFASGNSATARSLSAVPLQASCFILLFDVSYN